MRFNRWIACLTAGFVIASTPLSAETVVEKEQVQVPNCLAAQLKADYQILAENNQFKIIELASSELDGLTRIADKAQCGRFINLSHRLNQATVALKQDAAKQLLNRKSVLAPSLPTTYEIKNQALVNAAIAQIEPENIMQTLTHLTNYYNRSARQKTGVLAAEWLKAEFEGFAMESGRRDVDTYFVDTGRYMQPSLVTVIGKDINAPAVVIGAHMDTLDGRMPGAGDDGSGSSSVMEMARVLLSQQTQLKRPVYIIWYAAEERGLVGSQYVVEDFLNKAIPVRAAIQFDMTGFRNNAEDPTMWVYRDYTDTRLSDFVTDLIKTYVKVPVAYSRCGYGCSDHASWMAAGIPAAFPCETDFENHNPYIHTSADTMSLLSLEHMTNFTKLGLAFAIELANS